MVSCLLVAEGTLVGVCKLTAVLRPKFPPSSSEVEDEAERGRLKRPPDGRRGTLDSCEPLRSEGRGYDRFSMSLTVGLALAGIVSAARGRGWKLDD